VYCFGMTLYVLIAEEEPFATLIGNHWEMVTAICKGDRPPVVAK
jgi:hypothetical protein